jgi:hypothetical protein
MLEEHLGNRIRDDPTQVDLTSVAALHGIEVADRRSAARRNRFGE